MNVLFKKGARVHVESSDNLVILKKDQRAEFRTKLAEKLKEVGWNKVESAPYDHHLLYEIA